MSYINFKQIFYITFILLLFNFSMFPALGDDTKSVVKVEIFNNTNDGFVDRVRIIPIDEYSRIAVFESLNGDNYNSLGFAKVGINFTEFPTIEFHDSERISIHQGCTTECGRFDTLTEYKVVNRNDELKVVGYTRISSDRLAADARICDVNLLNKKAEIGLLGVDNKIVNHNDTPILLDDLSQDYIPKICP